MSKIIEMMQEYKNKKTELIETIRSSLNIELKGIFEANPKLYGITWLQYTPYFNDGDECVFGVYEIFPITLSKFEENECVNSPYNYYSYEYDGKFDIDEVQDSFGQIEKIMKEIPDDFYQELFGDHVQVIITKDNIEVREYPHD